MIKPDVDVLFKVFVTVSVWPDCKVSDWPSKTVNVSTVASWSSWHGASMKTSLLAIGKAPLLQLEAVLQLPAVVK